MIVDLDFFRSSFKLPTFHFIMSIKAVALKLPTFWTTCPLAVCWFHRRFGSKAQRCDRSCKHYSSFTHNHRQRNAKALHCAVSTSENHKHTQLFVTDSISKRCFLADTGAQVSVTPAFKLDKRTGSRKPPLQAANGSTITTYGTRVVCLRFGQRNFQARLIAADVSRPLLGADFLRTHNLLVDMRNRRLIEADTFSGIP